MKANKSSKKLIITGILTAIGASMCCITPVLALIAGSSGTAASLTWMESLRPYFIAVTIVVIGFAWYQKMKVTKSADDCGCEPDEVKKSWIQSKSFLLLVTVFSIIVMSFPYYSHIFYSETKLDVVQNRSTLVEVDVKILGMTCESCEHHVSSEITKLKGITSLKVSYQYANALITYDSTKTSIREIEKSISSTGYKVEPN